MIDLSKDKADFPKVSADSAPEEIVITGSEASSSCPSREDFVDLQRRTMMNQIKEALRKPLPGEKHELGSIEKSEFNNNGAFMFFKTATSILRLSNPSPQTLHMKAFTPDVENLEMGCGMTSVEIPVIITFKSTAEKKGKTQGNFSHSNLFRRALFLNSSKVVELLPSIFPVNFVNRNKLLAVILVSLSIQMT